MKFNTKIPEPIGFQLAPMLDVVFLLLIFFVVTQKFILNEQDLKVKVPTAPKSTEETSRAIDEIIINAREEEPFFSVEDLQIRAKISKTVIEMLRANGVLDNINETDQMTMTF